jgi:hypothetical protein
METRNALNYIFEQLEFLVEWAQKANLPLEKVDQAISCYDTDQILASNVISEFCKDSELKGLILDSIMVINSKVNFITRN